MLFAQRGLLGGSAGQGGGSPQGGSGMPGAAWGRTLGHRRETGWSTGFSRCPGPLQPSLQELPNTGKKGRWLGNWGLMTVSLFLRAECKGKSDSPWRCHFSSSQGHKGCFSCLCIAETRGCYRSERPQESGGKGPLLTWLFCSTSFESSYLFFLIK